MRPNRYRLLSGPGHEHIYCDQYQIMIAFQPMKQYVIDEIRPEDYKEIKSYLDKNLGKPELGNLYWLQLSQEVLTSRQAEHESCQPLCVALELEPDKLTCELLVRTRQRVRCDCIGYATSAQRNWIVDSIDAFFEALGIIT